MMVLVGVVVEVAARATKVFSKALLAAPSALWPAMYRMARGQGRPCAGIAIAAAYLNPHSAPHRRHPSFCTVVTELLGTCPKPVLGRATRTSALCTR